METGILLYRIILDNLETRASKDTPAARLGKSARGFILGSADLTVLTMSESTFGHNKYFEQSFGEAKNGAAIPWSIFRGMAQVLMPLHIKF